MIVTVVAGEVQQDLDVSPSLTLANIAQALAFAAQSALLENPGQPPTPLSLDQPLQQSALEGSKITLLEAAPSEPASQAAPAANAWGPQANGWNLPVFTRPTNAWGTSPTDSSSTSSGWGSQGW